MRVTLVFPPALCLPNPIYYALPLLAGALKEAGHEVHLVDLNVIAADRLLTPEWADRVLDLLRGLRAERTGEAAEALDRLMAHGEPRLRQGPECKAVLRDPVRNFEPGAFKHAFSTVIEALDFYYQLDPIIPPRRARFGEEVTAHVKQDPWSPLRDLYDEELLDEVLRHDPELVGITVAFAEQAAESVRLAARLRSRGHAHIAFGGPLIGLFPDRWIEGGWLFDFADSLVLGEGDQAVVHLVEWLEGRRAREKVRNLVFRDPSGTVRRNDPAPVFESMDDLALPDFEPADLSLYFTPRPIFPLMLSRGCYWGRCAFCSMGWRQNFRKAPEEVIRDHAKDLAERYDARYIMLQDSSIPPRGAFELARIVKEEELPLYWMGAMKFEKIFLNPDYCRRLAAGGCRSLLLGFETASQRLLDLMGKGFRLEEVPKMLKNLREAGVSAELLWFLGFPTETRQEVLRTARYLMDHRPLFGLASFVGSYELHPDTRIHDFPEDYGVTLLGEREGRYLYTVETGMGMEEKDHLTRLFASTENRNLACNGAHLPHLVERGLDLSDIEHPMRIPEEVITFCAKEEEEA